MSDVDRLVEQARAFTPKRAEMTPLATQRLVAGLADAVERLERDRKAWETAWFRDTDRLTDEADEARARVAALEAIAIQAPCHCIGSGSTHDIPRVTYRCPRCELLDGRVPSTGQETT